ncbi:MAG: hypothetical protein HOH33_05035 [Verrucomicrobia bacterium]|nr:hypothetical protein [Verrucomicrobiota bacterium]
MYAHGSAVEDPNLIYDPPSLYFPRFSYQALISKERPPAFEVDAHS